MADGDKTISAPLIPSPLRVVVNWPNGTFPKTVSIPLREPIAAGVKLTWMLQVACAASGPEQLFCWVKSPVAVTCVTRSGCVPVLVTVTICEAAVVCIGVSPKAMDAGATVAVVCVLCVEARPICHIPRPYVPARNMGVAPENASRCVTGALGRPVPYTLQQLISGFEQPEACRVTYTPVSSAIYSVLAS